MLRLRYLIVGTAALLEATPSVCLGCGSGPHPNILIAIPTNPQTGATAGETIGLMLSLTFAGILITIMRTAKKS